MTWITDGGTWEHGERRQPLPDTAPDLSTDPVCECGEMLARGERVRCTACDRLYDLTGPTPTLIPERPWSAPTHPKREG